MKGNLIYAPRLGELVTLPHGALLLDGAGAVRRFPDGTGCKIPQIGWNQCVTARAAIDYYFVHSYYAEICPYTIGRTAYAGVEFTSLVRKGNLLACQFHPEKSGRCGLELLKGWLAL